MDQLVAMVAVVVRDQQDQMDLAAREALDITIQLEEMAARVEMDLAALLDQLDQVAAVAAQHLTMPNQTQI
tara:strand:+ start:38 stop:250 length:213 start_codon:yes stop_codon:yes gene_type:complete